MLDDRQRRACATFAGLLAYPRGDGAALARQALALAGRPATPALARFAAAVEALPASALEELYTATFDLAPACAPYLGVQLLRDDDPVRGLLLAKLAELYAAEGYRRGEELPDHLIEVLGFVAMARPGPARDDLVRDGLVPALARMVDALDGENPYRHLLLALGELLQPAVSTARAAAEVRP